LSLGFSATDDSSLEKVPFPSQKVLNMGYIIESSEIPKSL
jgi:hypothetical protein